MWTGRIKACKANEISLKGNASRNTLPQMGCPRQADLLGCVVSHESALAGHIMRICLWFASVMRQPVNNPAVIIWLSFCQGDTHLVEPKCHRREVIE